MTTPATLVSAGLVAGTSVAGALFGTATIKPIESNIAAKPWASATAGSGSSTAGLAIDGDLSAKFRRTASKTKDDTRWFIGELRKELETWTNRKSRRVKNGRVPECLTLTTNVVGRRRAHRRTR
ncbi:hypothetical protein AB0H12_38945 [Actinosynnema sp. NPDC023794]